MEIENENEKETKMQNWKSAMVVGSLVCINNYDGLKGIRFGVVEDVWGSGFLVKMEMDKNDEPFHYDNGIYRSYKNDKIKDTDIVVI